MAELLFNQCGPDVVITEAVIKIITRELGAVMMRKLLNERGEEIVITEEVVTAAAGKFQR